MYKSITWQELQSWRDDWKNTCCPRQCCRGSLKDHQAVPNIIYHTLSISNSVTLWSYKMVYGICLGLALIEQQKALWKHSSLGWNAQAMVHLEGSSVENEMLCDKSQHNKWIKQSVYNYLHMQHSQPSIGQTAWISEPQETVNHINFFS